MESPELCISLGKTRELSTILRQLGARPESIKSPLLYQLSYALIGETLVSRAGEAAGGREPAAAEFERLRR